MMALVIKTQTRSEEFPLNGLEVKINIKHILKDVQES
jgi:hypothetical protein